MNFKLTCSGWLLLVLVLFTYDQGTANPWKRSQSLSKRSEDDSRQKRVPEENVPPLGPDVERPRGVENLPQLYMPMAPTDMDESASVVPYLARASEENVPPPYMPSVPRASGENGPPYNPIVPRSLVENYPPFVDHGPRSPEENVPPPYMLSVPRASGENGPPYNPIAPRSFAITPPPFVNYEPRSSDENALRKLVHEVRRSFRRSPKRSKRLYPGDGCFGRKIDRIGAASGMGCGSSSSG